MAKTLFDFCHARDCMELLTQWDCRANLPLTPQTIFHGSRKSVWWQCEKGHHWRASVNSRTSGKTNCPYCSGRIAWPGETDLASRFPALAKEWHPTKNLPLTPDHVLPGSERKVWWRCSLWAMSGRRKFALAPMAAAALCVPIELRLQVSMILQANFQSWIRSGTRQKMVN